ncbi:lipopolysaccharide biosynthesis protein [Microbacterium sp. SORGH_AS428]|uniref:rhamnan synthesis F family protein n=1 Tax=Microbacterium sp. SORGH_AS_0428 TaxID=3041788 RepID=UPI002854648D|nr:rhamnan synthesis F family protein [Microbacterium sp. SORGH_AS_0428]MDR6199089.1 lipopolysaccharide biosynthesis protein [Microbacterium sp. SORGH_AS_0428]
MSERADQLATYPAGGRRVIFYLFYDPQGIVDDYVAYKLERLRPFAEHIFVVVNGQLSDQGRARLEPLVDTIWLRENVGFDVWGYKKALEEFGEERLAAYDELILMNYTWFGPVNPFEPVFERMDNARVDFWGMTEHAKQVPNPFTRRGVLPSHIQSHWISVRRSMFLSDAWRAYWRDMPPIVSYTDSILSHESRFTDHFSKLGFTYEVAFPQRNYSTWHPAFYDAEALLEDGCPALKRRPFFHDPLLLDRHSIIARRFAEKADALGYPVDMIWRNIARSSQPKAFNTNAAMLEIMPDTAISYDETAPLRVAVVAHIFYVELTREMLGYCASLPSEYDLFITTVDESSARVIRTILDEVADPHRGRVDVRVLPSNRGRDMGAFFVGCADVLRSDDYDVIFKIHSKKTVQEGKNAGDLFRRHQMMNLLNSPGYAANLLGLFQHEPGLGIAYAPTIHIGYPTLGRGWFGNKDEAEKLSERLGIHVPFDDPTPLAPYGCMFAFRPEALRLLTDVEWTYKDYPSPKNHKDGSVAHVQERLFSYAAAELGFYTKTVATTRYAAISHTSLEYKLDRISANVQGYAIDQVHLLDASGDFLGGGPVGYALAYMKLRHPRWYPLMAAVHKPLRSIYRGTRYALDPAYRRWRRSERATPVEDAVDEMDLL